VDIIIIIITFSLLNCYLNFVAVTVSAAAAADAAAVVVVVITSKG
jgi:hypothetical protein